MASVQILVNTMDYTPLVDYETVHVNNNVIMTSDTMDFTIYINTGETVIDTATGSPVAAQRPKCGESVIWQNPANIIVAPDGTNKPYREFAGVIDEVKETIDGTTLVYEVHVKSFVRWLDRRMVSGYYNQDRPENIIKAIVAQYAPTFTTYNVQSTTTTVIPQYFDYRAPSDAIKTIADQIEYGWYVDYFSDVHFYALETITTPLPANTLDVDNDLANYGDLQINENSEQQYNRIIIKGFKTRSTNFLMLTYPGDGQTTQWSTGYRISSLTGDAAVAVFPSLSAYQTDAAWAAGGNPTNGTKLTVKKDIIDGAPDRPSAANTAYIHYTQHMLRVSNYNGGVLPVGAVLAMRFFYLRDLTFLGQDPQAQAVTGITEGGTTGVYEYVHTDKSLTNSTLTAVQSKAQLLLSKYGNPQINGTFVSYLNTTTSSGWRAGQYFRFKTVKRFGGIDEYMFVQRVLKSIVKNDTGGLIALYNVEFADSPYLV